MKRKKDKKTAILYFNYSNVNDNRIQYDVDYAKKDLVNAGYNVVVVKCTDVPTHIDIK